MRSLKKWFILGAVLFILGPVIRLSLTVLSMGKVFKAIAFGGMRNVPGIVEPYVGAALYITIACAFISLIGLTLLVIGAVKAFMQRGKQKLISPNM